MDRHKVIMSYCLICVSLSQFPSSLSSLGKRFALFHTGLLCNLHSNQSGTFVWMVHHKSFLHAVVVHVCYHGIIWLHIVQVLRVTELIFLSLFPSDGDDDDADIDVHDDMRMSHLLL